MRIADMRAPAGGTVWETNPLESYRESRYISDHVRVETSRAYLIEFERCDLAMLKGVVASLEAHPRIAGSE